MLAILGAVSAALSFGFGLLYLVGKVVDRFGGRG